MFQSFRDQLCSAKHAGSWADEEEGENKLLTGARSKAVTKPPRYTPPKNVRFAQTDRQVEADSFEKRVWCPEKETGPAPKVPRATRQGPREVARLGIGGLD